MKKKSVVKYESDTHSVLVHQDEQGFYTISDRGGLNVDEITALYKLLGEILAEKDIYIEPVEKPKPVVEFAPRNSKFEPEVY